MIKTAILEKNGLTALLGIRPLATGQAVLIRTDPRDGEASSSLQDSLEMAERNLSGSIRKSVKRGWRLVHFGIPNYG
jgi:hypothetical protein